LAKDCISRPNRRERIETEISCLLPATLTRISRPNRRERIETSLRNSDALARLSISRPNRRERIETVIGANGDQAAAYLPA